MNKKVTTEYAKELQKEAEWAYDKAKEKFYYSMLEVIFLKLKSHLNKKGLLKVIQMDERRDKNENFSIEFSQKTWLAIADSWAKAESFATKKIADLYELETTDLDTSKISSNK